MSPNIHFEVRLLVMGIMAGAGLMALYDLLRLFRALVPHGWFWMGLEDLGIEKITDLCGCMSSVQYFLP